MVSDDERRECGGAGYLLLSLCLCLCVCLRLCLRLRLRLRCRRLLVVVLLLEQGLPVAHLLRLIRPRLRHPVATLQALLVS